MGALLSAFLSFFEGTSSALAAREAAGGEGICDLAAPLTDPLPDAVTAPAPSAPQATAPAASTAPATAPAATAPPATAPTATAPPATAPTATAPPATAAPHKADSEPEPADVRAAATKAEGEMPLCGLHDNEKDWKLYQFPPRIKECTLEPADRAKLLEHLARIFDEDTLEGKRVVFDPIDVARLIYLIRPIIESEPMLIDDVPLDITVVGDLHGQLHDLHRVFAAEERDGKKGWENMKYLFLGDYVDRGRQAIEILMCLFSLKCLYPDRIFLLRGNHEFMTTNLKYGFPLDLWDRYSESMAITLYNQFNATFCYLSVIAIIGNKYLCAHGGISLSGMTRKHWKGIVKPYLYSQDDIVVHDTIWSDPAGGLRGSSFNAERHTSHYYGLDMLAVALHSMECKLLIRAHTMLESGYDLLGNLCLSIFTATGVRGGNDGAVAIFDANGKLKVRILEVDRERVAWDKKLKIMDANHFEDTDSGPEEPPDEVTIYGGDDLGSGVLKDMKNSAKN